MIVHVLQVLQQPGANRMPLQALAGPCRAGAQVKGGKRRKPAELCVDLRLIRGSAAGLIRGQLPRQYRVMRSLFGHRMMALAGRALKQRADIQTCDVIDMGG